MQAVYILSAVRTPIGKFGGSLASQSAADMGVIAAKAAIERAGVRPEQIGEAIFGNARQAGGGPNPARQISVRSGVPDEVPAFTVNQACASGMKAVALAYLDEGEGEPPRLRQRGEQLIDHGPPTPGRTRSGTAAGSPPAGARSRPGPVRGRTRRTRRTTKPRARRRTTGR